MSTTTNYNLQKPAPTDYYDVAVPNANMNIIDTQLKANADNITGKANSSHSHTEGDLPNASITEQGVVQLSNLLTGTSQTKAATENAAKLLNDKCVAIENAIGVPLWAAQDSAGYFTITISGVTAYSQIANKRLLVSLGNGLSAAATSFIRVNTLAYCAVLNGSTILQNVKPVDYAKLDLFFDGTNFFALNAGGGIELPSTITAGDVIVKPYLAEVIDQTGNTAYHELFAFTVKRAGTYRFEWYYKMNNNGPSYHSIFVNGAQNVGSEATGNGTYALKTIDIVLTANAVVSFRCRGYNSATWPTHMGFVMKMLWAELTTELAKIV